MASTSSFMTPTAESAGMQLNPVRRATPEPHALKVISLEDALWLSWKALTAQATTAQQLLSTTWTTQPSSSPQKLPLASIQSLTLTAEGTLQGTALLDANTTAQFSLSEKTFAIEPHASRFVQVSDIQLQNLLSHVLPSSALFVTDTEAKHLGTSKQQPLRAPDSLNGFDILNRLLLTVVPEHPEQLAILLKQLRAASPALNLHWVVTNEHFLHHIVQPGGERSESCSITWHANLYHSSNLPASMACMGSSSLRDLYTKITTEQIRSSPFCQSFAQSWYSSLLVAMFLAQNPQWCITELSEAGVTYEITPAHGLLAIHNCFGNDASWLQLKGQPANLEQTQACETLLGHLAEFTGAPSDGLLLLSTWASHIEHTLAQC